LGATGVAYVMVVAAMIAAPFGVVWFLITHWK
jgi:hypothetical protein